VGRRRVIFFSRVQVGKKKKTSELTFPSFFLLFFFLPLGLLFLFKHAAPRRTGPDAAPGLAQDPRHGQRPGLLLEPGDQHDDLREADGGRRRRGALMLVAGESRRRREKNSRAQAAADDVFFLDVLLSLLTSFCL